METIKKYMSKVTPFLQKVPRWAWGVFAVGMIIGVYVAMHAVTVPVASDVQAPYVEVKSVSDLSQNAPGLQVAGTVQSVSEATVRAEKSGQVVAVYHELGDKVSAGTLVAELEHATESAAVQQASAAVDAAKASLAKVTGGARTETKSILSSGVDTAEVSLASAQSGAVNTLLSAYAAIDSATRGSTDKLFSNPESSSPQFNVTSSDSQLMVTVANERMILGKALARESARSRTLAATDDLDAELATTIKETRAVRDFLDNVIATLNKGIASTNISDAAIAGDLAGATASRASITGTLSALTAAQAGLKGARSGVSIAQQSLNQGVTGGQPEDVAAAEAAVKQAQAGLAAAQAAYEHSVIRAPISGTVNSFSLKRGDYVSMMSPVLTVANNGSLEIVAYVTEDDAKEIVPYSKVKLDSGGTGMVTRIAPAIDPLTKKIELRIAVDDTTTLTNGQSVLVSLTRAVAHTSKETTPSKITVPISAIKIGPDSASVFTLDEKKALIAHTVTLGALLGDRVEITGGISPEMDIVTDARGLHEGEMVVVKGE